MANDTVNAEGGFAPEHCGSTEEAEAKPSTAKAAKAADAKPAADAEEAK